MKVSKTKNRILHYFLIGIIAASVLTTALAPMVSAKAAAAMTPTENAKSFLYYNSLSVCIKLRSLSNGYSNDSIQLDAAQAGKWFDAPLANGTDPSIGYFLAGKGVKTDGDSKVGCAGDNTDWITDAAKLWGYSGGIDLLCDSGAVRINGSDCRIGNGDFTGDQATGATRTTSKLNLGKFQTNIKNKVYGGKTPTLTNAANYVLDRDSFFAGCLRDINPTPYAGKANDSFLFSNVTVIDGSGTKVQVPGSTGLLGNPSYYGKLKRTDKIEFYVSSSLQNTAWTCQAIVDEMNLTAAAYAAVVEVAPDTSSPTTSPADGKGTSTCNVDGIGWVICPSLRFISKLADGSFVVVQAFMVVKPLNMNPTDPTNGLYTAWSLIRNLANVAFVVAFLIIIFSQMTSVGVTNYGVKKTLPRLIVSALLVNLSFFLSAILVDVSNILGSSIVDLFKAIADQSAATTTGPTWSTILDSILVTGGAAVVGGVAVAAAIGAAGGAVAALAALLPILVVALIALIVAMVVLIGRQALIVILIVLSPMAFVAYLLPNTEKWFKKWYTTFSSMLFLYPMVALLYGGASLASAVLLTNARAGKGGAIDFFMVIGALGVQVIPLFAVVTMIKSSGGMLGKISGMAQKLSTKPGGALKTSAETAAKNASNRATIANVNKRWRGMGIRRKDTQSKRSANIEAGANRAITDVGVDRILDDPAYAQKIAGSSDPAAVARVRARAQGERNKLDEEEIQNISALNRHGNFTPEDHFRVLEDANSTDNQKAASIRGIGEIGGMADKNRLAAMAGRKIAGTGTIDPATGLVDRNTMQNFLNAGDRQEIQSVAAKSMGTDNPSFGGASIGEMGAGNFDPEASYSRYISGQDFSANSFLAMKDATKTAVINHINSTAAGSPERAAMVAVVAQIDASTELSGRAGPVLRTNLGTITP